MFGYAEGRQAVKKIERLTRVGRKDDNSCYALLST